MNWKQAKAFTIDSLDKAGVQGEARKNILAFERKLTTCRNMLNRGTAWETMTFSEAYHTARQLMDDLNACGEWGMHDAKYFDEWNRYQGVGGAISNCNLGDMLC